ncbi:uncharacterized protein [Macrobrachium rosenbergii]|uniref:uncharacterized protein n=1 Tax=Macrobrachium rosenbergii TaxID=79674 RepID=UPI0034D6A5A5
MALAVVCYFILLYPESPGASVNCLICNFSTSPSVTNENFRTCFGQRERSPLEPVTEVVSLDETLIRRSQAKNMEETCVAHRSLDVFNGINLKKSTCDESHLSICCDHQNIWMGHNKALCNAMTLGLQMLKQESLENNLTTFAKRENHQEFREALSIFEHGLETKRRRRNPLLSLSLLACGESASTRFNGRNMWCGLKDNASFLKWMTAPIFDCSIPLQKSHPFDEELPDFALTVKNKSSQFPEKEIPVSSNQIKISGSLTSSLRNAIFSIIAFGITGFMIFSTIFREAECFQSSTGLAADLSSSGFEKRISSALDLTTLLISLSDQQMQLQLLYNQQNEGKSRTILSNKKSDYFTSSEKTG